ncbi:MAG TPA: N-acetylmuramic acid 6-phosphate etherase [Aliiroseovarius sp.]|nr:N-acetylmuramic acid 6-phosphate etherase [Aliiroseovarius sp.]
MPDAAPLRPRTEQTHPQARGLDTREDARILSILLEAQLEAVSAVRAALPDLEKGACAMVRAIGRGGRIVYGAAGSSGLQALADGLEIPPTFGIPAERIRILRAGGFDNMTVPREGAEDDAEAAARDAEVIGPKDCVICLAASGNTTYAVTIMQTARARGATTIGIANNPGTRLLEADIPVLLPTPPEVIAGSTRLGAGTAQKVALNLMSTLMGIRLGHVMDGLMVNVATSNIKLRGRAEGIVCEITGCQPAAAREALEAAGWRVKEAILIRSGAKDLAQARQYLDAAGQNLRSALAALNTGENPGNRVSTHQLGEDR